MIHWKWIAQANARTENSGFHAQIIGRRDAAGYAEVEFTKTLVSRKPFLADSVARQLDGELTTAIPGQWRDAGTPARVED